MLEECEQFLQLDSNSGTFGPFRSCKTTYIVLASACEPPTDQVEVPGDISSCEVSMLPPHLSDVTQA